MTETSLLAGPALRRLRKREGKTQAAMAASLGISPSYLNLIERNQRPLSSRVLVRVIEQYDFDPRTIREDESIGGLDGLSRRFADERFGDLGVDRDEVSEFLATAPQAAAAFARLYDNASRNSDGGKDPFNDARREVERWRNHFADLDHAAEELADELRLSRGDVGQALTERLRDRHQLSVRILPLEVMPEAQRRLDLHARQLQLSEMLGQSSRNFQVAWQIAQLEQREGIEQIVAGAQLADTSARALFESHVTAYCAAAILMPYGRFLRACESSNYDFRTLQRRFNVSFEQVAHRLTTLQRVGQRGLPFFMARLDRAGQFSKLFTGGSGATMLESQPTCPLWNVHQAFEQKGELCVQSIQIDGMESGPNHWFTMAQAVEGSGGLGEARFVIVLGIEAKFADQLSAARGRNLAKDLAEPIGLGCARCHRDSCRQRSVPPRGTALSIDRMVRGITPFNFGSLNRN